MNGEADSNILVCTNCGQTLTFQGNYGGYAVYVCECDRPTMIQLPIVFSLPEPEPEPEKPEQLKLF